MTSCDVDTSCKSGQKRRVQFYSSRGKKESETEVHPTKTRRCRHGYQGVEEWMVASTQHARGRDTEGAR